MPYFLRQLFCDGISDRAADARIVTWISHGSLVTSADVSSATWVSHGWLATGVTEGGRTQHDSSVITPHTAPVIMTSHRPAVIYSVISTGVMFSSSLIQSSSQLFSGLAFRVIQFLADTVFI